MAQRTLTFRIMRYNPDTPDIRPHLQDFTLNEEPGMTLFVVLNKIREEQDPSLRFDFVCRASICGSCGMLVNGRPTLACRTLTKDLPEVTTLLPLPAFKLLGDLSVDTGTWFRDMSIRTEAWVHNDAPFDPTVEEERMDNETALRIYEAERCIECGCCIGGCATANLKPNFIGAAGINRVARFMVDPRDQRSEQEYFEVVGTEDGVFGCIGLMACDDNCPVGVPLRGQLAYVRRKMAAVGWKMHSV
ncbi:fumarate reductase iron-sulfur subunit [Alicyclobacillus sp. ALC3]|uniref:fumarate reductase iron-sulfur subunit n=1 Tax=Alicyclobacillus sp. ALC3 TaxID=2796143 RepID=UPI002379934D|nr:fumarate reductase iron-sulfur subunit [Alicyclobacillus sp. ALC3]WDL98634.1 fumarate reductase iron-sulfur subunit [Alicyclobacillus sp. ALC3]